MMIALSTAVPITHPNNTNKAVTSSSTLSTCCCDSLITLGGFSNAINLTTFAQSSGAFLFDVFTLSVSTNCWNDHKPFGRLLSH